MCKGTGKTSLAWGSNRDLVSSENPTPSPADPDLLSLSKQAILCEILDTIDSDDSDNDVVVSSASVYSVCSYCKHPPKKGEDLKRCSRCQFTRYCSEQCQRRIGTFTGLLVPLWPRSRTL